MRVKPTLNSVVIAGLIAVFLIARHSLVALRLGPLRLDPCDAVNAFSVLAIFVIAAGFPMRRLLPAWRARSLAERQILLIRSQQAVVLAVFLNVAAALVGLGRHSTDWANAPIRNDVLFAVGSLALACITAQVTTAATWRTLAGSRMLRGKRVVVILTLVIAILTFCPEWPICSHSVMAHALTVACGAMIVLVPMRILLCDIGADRGLPCGRWPVPREWVSLTVGILLGWVGFLPAIFTGQKGSGHIPVAAMTVGGLLLAYAFLGSPLGLTRSGGEAS